MGNLIQLIKLKKTKKNALETLDLEKNVELITDNSDSSIDETGDSISEKVELTDYDIAAIPPKVIKKLQGKYEDYVVYLKLGRLKARAFLPIQTKV